MRHFVTAAAEVACMALMGAVGFYHGFNAGRDPVFAGATPAGVAFTFGLCVASVFAVGLLLFRVYRATGGDPCDGP